MKMSINDFMLLLEHVKPYELINLHETIINAIAYCMLLESIAVVITKKTKHMSIIASILPVESSVSKHGPLCPQKMKC